jgi:predicted permease
VFYLQDLRYACRQLGRNLAFTVLTMVVLAGGLSVSIFTFSFLYTAMLKPLPVPQGDEIVRIMVTAGGRTIGLIDAADLAAVRQGVTSVAEIGTFTDAQLVIGSDDASRSISATATEWNIFAVTRTPPFMGRGFTVDDQAVGAEPVIVLTYATWQAVFGGDAAILDSLVPINGTPTRVIGIMPMGYGFPVATDAYVPIRPELLTATTPGGVRVQAYARLAPGSDRSRASAELTALLQRVYEDRPAVPNALRPGGMSLQTFQMSQIDAGPIVLVVLNMLAALILMLACVNVTNLLLTRANERARETAVRLALGASRARLIVQTTWESVLLTVAGGALATGLVVWALDAVNGWAQATLPGNLAFWWVWGYDPSVLGAAAAFVIVTIAVLAGVASRRAVNTEINAVLQEGVSRAGSRAEGRVARVLVVAQVVAVSLLMFVGSLSAIVAYRVVNIELGYDIRNVLTAGLFLPADRYPNRQSRIRFFEAVMDRLDERGEIQSAVLRMTLADGETSRGDLEIANRGEPVLGHPRGHVIAALGSLPAAGVELVSGRLLTAEDGENGAKIALVSRAMVELYWPNRSPLGEQITLTGIGETEPRTVVGIVGDVVFGEGLGRRRSTVGAYIPLLQTEALAGSVQLRHRGSEQAARAAYQETLTALDPLLVSEVRSFEELVSRSTALWTSVTDLVTSCVAFALLLAISGTYGLMARSIGRRTREIGVRRALGATDGTISKMLLGHGARQLGIGALIALPLLLAIGWGFSLLLEISFALTAATAFGVSAAITLIVLGATWLPTRRAIAIAPRDAIWRE